MTARLHLRSVFLLIIAVLVLILLIPLSAMASTVSILDQAHVLNADQVRTEGAKLPDALSILTTMKFSGDVDALNLDARQKLPDQQSIVIEIDTAHRNLSVQAGTSVKLSDDQAAEAVDAFKNKFGDGGYTSATIAAIDSLHESLVDAPNGALIGKVLAVLAVMAVIAVLVYNSFFPRNNRTPIKNYARSSSYSDSYTGPHYSSWGSSDSGGGSGGSSGGDYGGGAGGHF